MEEQNSSLNLNIAAQVRRLRAGIGLSLEDLAGRSGVSRSMISLIERAESSPTAVVLERLSVALKVPLATLFDAPSAPADPIARRATQVFWSDPDSGYARRNVSPAGMRAPVKIVEVEFPAGARVGYENAGRDTQLHQQVWILEGRLEIRVGEDLHQLDCGDCLAMTLDQPVVFHNPGQSMTRYAVVIANAFSVTP